MTRITFIEHNGTPHTVEATDGETVMQAATGNMVPGIIAECGGACSCGTCHGYIDPRWTDKFPPPATDEAGMLECVIDRQDNSRMTCQLKVRPELDGLVVRLPLSQF